MFLFFETNVLVYCRYVWGLYTLKQVHKFQCFCVNNYAYIHKQYPSFIKLGQYFCGFVSFHHRVHTEWRLPISGVHPIMMEKSALVGAGWGEHSHPLSACYHHIQSCSVRSWLREQIHSLYFISTLLCGFRYKCLSCCHSQLRKTVDRSQ